MNYWLFKTEPAEFGIEDLASAPLQTARWDQIRNFQARNFIRDHIKSGDAVFIYHSQCRPLGIAGMASVVTPAYPDPTQFDSTSGYFDPKSTAESPRWYCLDISLTQQWTPLLPLSVVKAQPALQDMVLLKQGRLSVQPVTKTQATRLIRLGNAESIT